MQEFEVVVRCWMSTRGVRCECELTEVTEETTEEEEEAEGSGGWKS